MSDSIWKKDLSLRRKSKPAEPELPPAPVGEAETPPPATADVPNLPAGDYGWLTSSFDPASVPDNMPVVSAPPVSLPPPVTTALTPDAPAPVPTVAAPEVEVVAVAAVAAVAEKKHRRELKLPTRTKKQKEPKQQKKQKEPKAQKEPKEPKEGGAPFWKRELKLSRPKLERGPKAPKEPKEPKQPKEKQVKERKPPIWKRELDLSRLKLERGSKGPKQPKDPKQPKAPKQLSPHKTAIVGLKIGASQVAAARVSNHGHPQLLQIAREPLPDGVVVGGELRDVEGLTQALKDLFSKNKLPRKGVRLGIANNRIGVRTFEISGIDEPRQLANAIRFRAQETLPIPLEEAVLDWRVLSESKNEETGEITRHVLLVVAYRELVDRYLLACKKAGIKLSGIDLEAFAMLRALNAPLDPDAPDAAGAQVFVNVGHDRSTFAVSNGRVCEFTRVLGWGGQSLSVAIARALDITPSEAMPIKHALSLVAQAEPPEDISPETLGTAREAVMRELQAFARELVSSLRFYQNQPGSLGIGELVLTGGTAHLPGFADELNKLIGVPVKVGDPLNRVAIPKKFSTPDDYSVGSLTVAIGLGIED
jgi:type IV pilus assembly protein PilM